MVLSQAESEWRVPPARPRRQRAGTRRRSSRISPSLRGWLFRKVRPRVVATYNTSRDCAVVTNRVGGVDGHAFGAMCRRGVDELNVLAHVGSGKGDPGPRMRSRPGPRMRSRRRP